MIYIVDDFIDKNIFTLANKHLDSNKFQKLKAGKKDFHVQNSNKDFDDYVISKLSLIEDKKITNILSFFRVATDKLDISWRIHSDLNIDGQKPDRALVLYLSPREMEDLHGTALWEHDIYGRELPSNISDKDYNDMIDLDSNNLNKWRLSSVVGYEENRLISYPASYFHSKYPNVSWKEGRKVFVMFYKVSDYE
tara:strand:+ start:540 stop:1121 length:582 start_codon:yes stop_codon:yes gene_type:complete